MTLKDLLKAATPLKVSGETGAPVAGLSHDSRTIGPGEIFFALPGSRTDGNRHVRRAVELGAMAVVSELEPPPAPISLGAAWVQVQDVAAAMGRMADRFFAHPSGAMAVIGVTGTNGKTTTTYFLEAIVRSCGGLPAVAGTINYRVGGKVLERATNTTPLSLELLRLLSRFREAGASHALLEVSSHALALKRVEEVDFDAAIFTNLGRDHLDFHKTIEEYFRAKAHLFELLGRASSTKKKRLAVLNADDPRSEALRRLCLGAVLRYGRAPQAEFRIEGVRPEATGTRFELLARGRRLSLRTRLLGAHNAHNAAAAAAAAFGLGLPEEGVLRGIADLASVPGRLEPVEEGLDFKVLVDYAHTDSALEAVLSTLRGLPHGRIVTVFGCGGERDRTKRGPMGLAACGGSDLAIVTSDNPRGEDPLAIIADVEAALKTAGNKNYRILPDRAEAIACAVGLAGPGDIVLIAGKGHEDTQTFKDRTIPFDDREVARAALRSRT